MSGALSSGRIVVWRESDVVDGMVLPIAIMEMGEPISITLPDKYRLSTTWPPELTITRDPTRPVPTWEVRRNLGGIRDRVMLALSIEGAVCGECSTEPGDYLDCSECTRWLGIYADALAAAGLLNAGGAA